MSLPTLRGTAKLLGDPRTGPTKTGGTWTSALLKFQAWRKTDAGWEEGDSVVASAIAFDEVAADLATFARGDQVEVRGSATIEVWKDQPRLKITVAACRVPVKEAPTQREPVAA